MKRAAALALSVLLVASSADAQQPTPSFGDIVACAKALKCKNMQVSSTHWFDVVNIPVVTFKDGDTGFAVAASRQGGLSVWVTMPGERRPSRLLTLSADDHVLSAELGPMPGDKSPQVRMTSEEMATWGRTHKAFNSGESTPRMPASGQEFKAFWDEQAKQAMAAIRRQMGR